MRLAVCALLLPLAASAQPAAGPASGPFAQVGIVASPNPFGSEDSTLALRNTGAASVTIDSLRFSSSLDPYAEGSHSAGWYLQYSTHSGDDMSRGDLVCDPIPTWPCRDGLEPEGLLGRTVASGDSVVFTGFVLYCAFCRAPAALPPRMSVNDTLRVYTNGGTTPYEIVLNDAGFVLPVEDGPAAPALRLDVYPNPAQERITVRLDVETPSELEAVIYDAAGRRVDASGPSSFAAGSAALPLRLGDLPSGVYTVEVRGRLATGAAVKRSGSFVVAE